MMNTFLLTTQTKMALMQTQIGHLTKTVKELQEKIRKLHEELHDLKDAANADSIPSIYDDYIPKMTIEPMEPYTVAMAREDSQQFVFVDGVEDGHDQDSESGSEYDSDECY